MSLRRGLLSLLAGSYPTVNYGQETLPDLSEILQVTRSASAPFSRLCSITKDSWCQSEPSTCALYHDSRVYDTKQKALPLLLDRIGRVYALQARIRTKLKIHLTEWLFAES